MKGTITWISPAKLNKKGQYYKQVTFQMLEGEARKASTYLVTEYKNYEFWKDKLLKGNILGGLEYIANKTGYIDADSPVLLVDGKFVTK
jgi:hypothetical protein